MPFDHFNLIAGCYDRAAQFTVTEPLLRLLALSSENILLDAGGGTGRVATALRGMVSNIVVADLSRGMLRRAANKGLATICTPLEYLPFSSGTFDRVIMVDALHHVFDQRLTAHELWRTLAPGGRILIIEPDIHQFVVKLLALGEKTLLMRSHFLPFEEITAFYVNFNAQISVVHSENDVIVLVEKDKQM
jgi:ubiquinone/menaquinone biosynthesis C-methylase UbiE